MLGKGAIGALLVKILGLFVLWTVVMAALKSNEITKGIVEPVANALGTVAKSVPLPLPGGSIGGLQKTKDAIVNLPSQYEAQKTADINKRVATRFGLDKMSKETEVMTSIQNARDARAISAALDNYGNFVTSYGRDQRIEAALQQKIKEGGMLSALNLERGVSVSEGDLDYSKPGIAKLVTKN